MAALSGALKMTKPLSSFSARSFLKSMTSASGSGRASTRLVIRSSVYLPRAAFSRDSSDGVAEPRTTGMLRSRARTTARSRAL